MDTMQRRQRASRSVTAVVVLLALLLGACGEPESTTTSVFAGDGGGGVGGGSSTTLDDIIPTATPRTLSDILADIIKAVPAAGPDDAVPGLLVDGGPASVSEFITAVMHDVDAYWSQTFAASEMPEPYVRYFIPAAGEVIDSACNDGPAVDDDAAYYCPGDDAIVISQVFARKMLDGQFAAHPERAPGVTIGDFALAYVVAHEFGHSIQEELGILSAGHPVWKTELQADCLAGLWANSAYYSGILEAGDIDEAIQAADLIGDFAFADPAHHGTPTQRVDAFLSGYDTGDPAVCGDYLTE